MEIELTELTKEQLKVYAYDEINAIELLEAQITIHRKNLQHINVQIAKRTEEEAAKAQEKPVKGKK